MSALRESYRLFLDYSSSPQTLFGAARGKVAPRPKLKVTPPRCGSAVASGAST